MVGKSPAPQAAPATAPAASSPQQVDGAQQAYGNGFLAEGLGSWLPDLGFGGQTPEDIAKEEQRDFLSTVWPPAEDFDTGTGGVFDATLTANLLHVTLKVGYDFVPGDPANAPVGTPPAELQWSRDDQDAFRAGFATQVMGNWTGKHPIRSTRPFWTTTVQVIVVVVEDDADPHFRIRVEKLPHDAGDGPASVCEGGTHHGGGGTCDPNAPGDESGTGLLDSRDNDKTRVRGSSQPLVTVYFDTGKSDLRPGETALDKPAADLVAHPDWDVEVTGNASTGGDAGENFQLARDRMETVAGELESDGVAPRQMIKNTAGEDGNDDTQFSRSADVWVLDVDSQVTSAHEAGHMFGLNDEYVSDGENPGDPLDPAYQKLIRENAELPAGAMPTKGAADSIMSNGMTVENWHYAPFVAAVKQITGSQDWTV